MLPWFPKDRFISACPGPGPVAPQSVLLVALCAVFSPHFQSLVWVVGADKGRVSRSARTLPGHPPAWAFYMSVLGSQRPPSCLSPVRHS